MLEGSTTYPSPKVAGVFNTFFSVGFVAMEANHKSRDWKVRFEQPKAVIWGKLLQFGLCDFKAPAICDL